MRSRENYSGHGTMPFLFLAIVARTLTMTGCASKLTNWHGPKSFISGVPPKPRDCHGLAALRDKFYVFGGNSDMGGGISPTVKKSHLNLNRYAVFLALSNDIVNVACLGLCP